MRIKRHFCFAPFAFLFFVTSPARTEFIPASSLPQLPSLSSEPLNSKSGWSVSVFQGMTFIESMTRWFEFFPSPVVILCDPNIEFKDVHEIPVGNDLSRETTWGDDLLLVSQAIASYQLVLHKGFVETAWGTEEAIKAIRKNMKTEVPPIALLAQNPVDLLSMWYTTSGLDFQVEAGLMDKFRAKEEDEFDPPPEALCINRTLPVSEFMDYLALHLGGSAWIENGTWTIGEFRNDAKGQALIASLLKALRKYSYHYEFSSPDTKLKRIGLPAYQAVVREFEDPEEFYTIDLSEILSTMDSPERDAYFLNQLEVIAASEESRMRYDLYTFLDTLTRRRCQEAIPLMRKIATDETHPDYYARICLNVLGVPLPARDASASVVFSATLENELNKTEVIKAKEVLYAFLDQFDLLEPRKVTAIATDENGSISFEGPLESGEGTWAIIVGQPVGDQVAVHTMGYVGPRNASGYNAYAIKRDGRWLFIKKGLMWMA